MALPRMKNYSAMSGYAYEYVNQGFRDVPGAREHVFAASGDRKTWMNVIVRVEQAAIDSWQHANRRELSSAERYAVAKLALFRAFDERESPAAMRDPVVVGPNLISELLASVGID
jgi:hypothetical protein